MNGGGDVLFNDDPTPEGIRAILAAHRILSAEVGIFVEPASAISVAGLLERADAGAVPAGATCVLAALAGEPRAAALGAGATVSALVALGAVLRGDLPINAAMAGWDGARPPADWRDQRRTWERWFVVRTGANAAAFAAALAALVALG